MENLTKSLISATRKGKVEEVSRLIQLGVDVNSSLALGNCNTALHISVLLSNEEITKILLKAGADMNLKNKLGFSPLIYGMDKNRSKIGEILRRAGCDIRTADINGVGAVETEMIVNAAVGPYRPFFSMSPDLSSPEGKRLFDSAFKWAAFKQQDVTFMVNLLKNLSKSTLNEITVDGRPLIHLVFSYKYLSVERSITATMEFMQAFIKLGYNINVKDRHGSTILNMFLSATYFEQHPSVLRFLLENGADPRAERYTDFSSCYFSSGNKSMNIIRLLLTYGVNIDWLEAFKKYTEIVYSREDISLYYRELKFLIEHIDVNAIDSKRKNLVSLSHSTGIWEFVIHHIALVETLDHTINQEIYNEIFENCNFKKYFTRCQKELTLAKKTFVTGSSWVTYFHLLTGTKCQLKNFSGNCNLKETFLSSKFVVKIENLFPIYGFDMKENVRDGIERRQLFDEATKVLSREFLMFNVDSVIINETLDCILRKRDLLRIIHRK